ncbi:MAG: hypothetical protein RR365_00975 [Bacteroides sp.]
MAAANKACSNILINEVADAAKEIVNDHISKDIYGAYSPVGSENGGYDRRGELGNPANTVVKKTGGNEILITNIASPSPPIFGDGSGGSQEDRLLYWINEGLVPNYFNKRDYPWMHSRDAIGAAQEEVNSSANITRAIRSGIERVFGK